MSQSMKAFNSTILVVLSAFQLLLAGCAKHESALLIQGKTVAAWLPDVKIVGIPDSNNPALDILNSAGPQAMPDLSHLLLEGMSAEIKAKAAYVMSGISYRNPKSSEVHDAIPALLTAAQNSNSEVRIYSVQALGAIGLSASNAVPVLIQLTRDNDGSVRMCAVEALGRIHASSPESVAALKVALSDSSNDVKITAKQALEIVLADAK